MKITITIDRNAIPADVLECARNTPEMLMEKYGDSIGYDVCDDALFVAAEESGGDVIEYLKNMFWNTYNDELCVDVENDMIGCIKGNNESAV